MAVQVDFYHLAASPIERVLPRIAERVTAAGGRLLVVAGDAGLLDLLDRALWTHAPDSFVAHGRAGAGDDADQPVLLSNEVVPVNRARAVALADGIWREEALAFDRVFHFFDDLTIAAARAAWKGLGRDGIERRFWKQDAAGRWAQAA